MMVDHVDRRLAAILAADVVGYSRMMAADESATLAALKHHRKLVFNPVVAGHNGRVIKVMGDGALVQFNSVVDAVKCALALQESPAGDAEVPLPNIVLRIGINLGDVRLDDGDVYGDGVNVAARLEPLAEPGGICIASTVKESIVGCIEALFEDGGEVQLKNIDRPIHIWRWHPPQSNAEKSAGPLKSVDSTHPSLAVLPFQNMSGDTEQEYFADGVVEDMITALSRFRSFAVVARNSSFVYKGRLADVRSVAHELGVRYVLEGSIRRSANRLRITAQLVEGGTGTHLWAEHYDGSTEDVFAFQDHITESVVTIVEPHIKSAEIARSRKERPESMEAYDLYLQALGGLHSGDPAGNVAALSRIKRAIALEPGNATYLAYGAGFLMQQAIFGWELSDADHNRILCSNYIERALSDGQDDATVVGICGNALLQYLREYDRGFELIRRAVALNPNNLDVVNKAGVANLHCGSLDDAVTYFLRAQRLSPNGVDSHWNLTGLAHVELARGNCEQALLWASKSMAANAHYAPCFWMLIAANARLGRMEEARRHLAKLLAISPGVTVASIRAGHAAKLPERIEPILEGLLLAGMPEA
ncbi:TolB-like protein/class 3 adenylate cyclase/Flp pilus assembly protein TadD [Rhizobium mesoamericanum]|uniref:adenylate/guanylate cyclase domain-containing protein n=1 Tax=Rhizobium mesoamericanum TaxID=1079800 RepID=UPI002780BA83|nr:adenylate/guanylate cyclase domain-containing protein [Rhizobium mesoamericanum]MDQ0558229.1 TolB-like protein/class 3 adenylate cyclase/Flp pilus assembly protein TadD [Rhizobium mesoamericanum]